MPPDVASDVSSKMDLMDAPVEDGAMPSPQDMGVGLDQEKMAAFDAAVNKRRDDEAALVTKNQAEAKSALAQLETERQTQFQGRMQANREKEQVKMEQIVADNESPNPWERVVSLVDLQADAVAAAGDTSRMRQVFIQMKNSAKASA